jgi:hypothetical protein
MTRTGQSVRSKYSMTPYGIAKILSQPVLLSTAVVHSRGLRKVRQLTIVEVPKRSKKGYPPQDEKLCRMAVEVSTEVSRSLLTLVHIVYLLYFLFSLAR